MFAVLSPPVSIPDPVVVEVTRYYAIKGRHEAQLVKEMNSKGYRAGKDVYWGYTSPTIRWTFDVKKREGQPCLLSNPKVSVVITTTLPQWNRPAETSDGVIKKWDELYAALKHHEGEHAQIAKDEATALVALMRSHPGDGSCKNLKSYFHDASQKLFQTDAAQNAALDQRTRHGIDEGVSISW